MTFNDIRTSIKNSPPFGSKHVLIEFPHSFSGDELAFFDRQLVLDAMDELENQARFIEMEMEPKSACFQILMRLLMFHAQVSIYPNKDNKNELSTM